MFCESRRYSLVTIVKVPELLNSEKKYRMINNYLLIKTIGHGSISKVFLAIDTEKMHLDVETKEDSGDNNLKFSENNICFDKCQLYAIKRISLNELSRKTNALMQLEREIKLLRSFHHSNILKLHEVLHSMKDNYAYIVLEYADFGSLNSIIEKGHRFSLESIQSIIKQVAEALKHIHSKGYVHQDIKPGNILLNSEGTALIADFGLGHSFQSATMIVGSPAFQAPEALDKSADDFEDESDNREQSILTKHINEDQEYNSLINRFNYGSIQLRNLKNNQFSLNNSIDSINPADDHCPQVREDVWSLGVTLYQLLFGNLPFIGENLYEIVSNIKEKPLQIPSNMVSFELENLIRKMLSVNPRNRMTLDEVLENPLIKNAPNRVSIHRCAREGTIPLMSKIDWKKSFITALNNYEKIECQVCDSNYSFLRINLLIRSQNELPKVPDVQRPPFERRNSLIPKKNVISFSKITKDGSKTPLRCVSLKRVVSKDKVDPNSSDLLQFPTYTKE